MLNLVKELYCTVTALLSFSLMEVERTGLTKCGGGVLDFSDSWLLSDDVIGGFGCLLIKFMAWYVLFCFETAGQLKNQASSMSCFFFKMHPELTEENVYSRYHPWTYVSKHT